MVDMATLFGIGFLAVCLLMTAGLTWLGFDEGEFTGAAAGGDGEEGEENAPGA